MPRCTAVLRTVASYSVMALMGHGLGDMGERNCGLTGLGRRREVLIKPMLLWNMWYLLSMISIFAAWMYRHLAVHGGGQLCHRSQYGVSTASWTFPLSSSRWTESSIKYIAETVQGPFFRITHRITLRLSKPCLPGRSASPPGVH
jgi:hypothetical protein